MAQIYFHCSTADGVLIDRSGAVLGDLAEARDHATLVVRSLYHRAQPGGLARLDLACQRRLRR